jgi:hypothetical protein
VGWQYYLLQGGLVVELMMAPILAEVRWVGLSQSKVRISDDKLVIQYSDLMEEGLVVDLALVGLEVLLEGLVEEGLYSSR